MCGEYPFIQMGLLNGEGEGVDPTPSSGEAMALPSGEAMALPAREAMALPVRPMPRSLILLCRNPVTLQKHELMNVKC